MLKNKRILTLKCIQQYLHWFILLKDEFMLFFCVITFSVVIISASPYFPNSRESLPSLRSMSATVLMSQTCDGHMTMGSSYR